MKSLKSLFAMTAAALAVASVPTVQAVTGDVYQSAAFNGITFKFTEFDADTLIFNISGTPTGNWSTAQFLGAFDIKDIGLNFASATGRAYGPGTPGYVNSGTPGTGLLGLNTQLSASSVDCQAAGSPPGSICFDLSPDVPKGTNPINLTYTINFSQAFSIAQTGPHLQIVWTATAGGPKVGSLYSLNISRTGSGSGGTPGSGSGDIPEPSSAALALLGLGLVGSGLAFRRRRNQAR